MTLKEKGKDVKHSSLMEYRPKELDSVFVSYDEGKRKVTCFCGEEVLQSIVPHLKKEHEDLWDKWKKIFVDLSNLGYSWKDIMRLFSASDSKLLFSWTVVEKTIRGEIEDGKIEYTPKPKKEINKWAPVNFVSEKTTVWDFPQRGDWAIHSGDYRGNWPPQIPRNLILKYTDEGDLVVDAFAGGGTTIIEAWLMDRRSVGLDVSKLAIQTMRAKINEMEQLANKDERISLKPEYRPVILEGNALELRSIIEKSGIDISSLRLVCAHPPYLNSVKYTQGHENDLAQISSPEVFSNKMKIFAKEVKGLINDNGICAVLIGDVRKNNKTIPLGMMTLNSFLSEGFELENIIIKTQHRDKSSEFWVKHKSEIIMMAHEYLYILRR